MRVIPHRRWRVTKLSKISGKPIPTRPPEASRKFWRERSAVRELNRLTDIAARTALPYTYRVQRIYGK